jgi:hypothetical protein
MIVWVDGKLNSFPKIIWQTHNHKQEWLPTHLSQIAATWKNLNPGWDYRYVDQVQRDEKIREYPEIYEIYKYSMPTIQSDIWRIVVTYEEGGCYADMDSVCMMPLDYMLKGIEGKPEMITVPENKGQGNSCNYIIKPKSNITKSVIDKICIDFNSSDPLNTFNLFIKSAYGYPNVSKLFNAAYHSLDYKNKFLVNNHEIDNYGKIMKYVDFVKENGLSITL